MFEITDDIQFNWELIIKNQTFFLTSFSVYYPFTEEELLKYKNTLIFGSDFNSDLDFSIPINKYSIYGLTFNKSIIWTKMLRNLYTSSKNISTNFDQFPISQESEIDYYSNLSSIWAFYFTRDIDEIKECHERDKKTKEMLETMLKSKVFPDWIEYIESFENYKYFRIIGFLFNKHFFNELEIKLKKDIPDFSLGKMISIIIESNKKLVDELP